MARSAEVKSQDIVSLLDQRNNLVSRCTNVTSELNILLRTQQQTRSLTGMLI